MELKLEEGSYVPDPAGGLERVRGSEERLQRVLMRLAARRGGFYPWPEYGSRLHTLGRLKPSEREAAAKLFVAEALAEEKEIRVLDVTYRPEEGDSARIELSLALPDGGEASITLGV